VPPLHLAPLLLLTAGEGERMREGRGGRRARWDAHHTHRPRLEGREKRGRRRVRRHGGREAVEAGRKGGDGGGREEGGERGKRLRGGTEEAWEGVGLYR
jgi:hypothetical protein